MNQNSEWYLFRRGTCPARYRFGRTSPPSKPRESYLDHVSGAMIFASMSDLAASRWSTGYFSPSP